MNQVELETLELKISKFLRYGVLIAAFFMTIGWFMQMFHQTVNPFQALRVYEQSSFTAHLHSAFASHDFAILISYVGLGVLISLPMIRVLLTSVLFFKRDEKVLGAIALFVMIALVISFSLGIVE